MSAISIFFICIFLAFLVFILAIVSSVDGASGVFENTQDNFIGSFGSYIDSFGQSSGS